ncbi:unnamed protein product [Alopecurus aequalis]
MPPPPAALPDELVEEIFLSLPPDEPAWLVRASLASKLWLGRLTGPRFRGRYRDFHGAPPMLGYVYFSSSDSVPPFVPTTKFGGARFPDDWGSRKYSAWDCRHGRVLLQHEDVPPLKFFLWDPMTGGRKELYAPDACSSLGAAVLCAGAAGCDHTACHEGPFRVAFVGVKQTNGGCVAYARVSLPEPDEWSEPCSVLHLLAPYGAFIEAVPSVLIQDALYFMLGYDPDEHVEILKYDLSSNRLSLIDAPRAFAKDSIHMAMEDGSLGFAHVVGLTLHLWSRQMGAEGVASWTQHRVIDLNKLLRNQNLEKIPRLVGSIEGSDTIFLITELGIYEIRLKSLRWKKLWKIDKLSALFPYMSFYNPPERASHRVAAN